jgi:peptidoglycan/xylan/chitin deacetylase (PgdA/CDA1 family)
MVCAAVRLSSARTGVALVYHQVGGNPGDPQREILASVSGQAFARQLGHLRRHYRVVPASGLLDAVRARRRGQRFPVSITFDDDLVSHVREALPALQRAQVTATFFLGGNSLNGPSQFWWQDLQRAVDERLVESLPHVGDAELHAALDRAPKAIFGVAGAIERLEPAQREEVAAVLRDAVGTVPTDAGLRAADVRSLVAAGHEIGFHTFRHDPLPALSDDALGSAVRDGREELAAVLAGPLDSISYPHGKADKRVADAARGAGFAHGFTTVRSAVTPTTDPLLVPRVPPAMSLGKTALRVARAVARSPQQ